MKPNVQSRGSKRPKVGVVLSAGAIKALSSATLFDFLDGENIPIDLLIGCSGGSIYSGLRATGHDTQQMIEYSQEMSDQKVFSQMNYRTLLNIANLPFGEFDISKGLIKQEASLQFGYKMFGDTQLEDLTPKTLLQATDIQTGEGVVLEQGSLAEAAYASGAYYPWFPPIFLHNRWLVDGSYTSVLPIMEAVKQGADIIIAMYFHEKLNPNPNHFLDAFHNVTRAYSDSLVKSQIALSIDMHHYEIIIVNVMFDKPIPLSGSSFIPEILKAGHRAVDFQKDEIIAAIQNYNPK